MILPARGLSNQKRRPINSSKAHSSPWRYAANFLRRIRVPFPSPHVGGYFFSGLLVGTRVASAIHAGSQERDCGFVENSHRVSAHFVFHDFWRSQAKSW